MLVHEGGERGRHRGGVQPDQAAEDGQERAARLGLPTEEVPHVGLVVDLEHQARELLELGVVDGLALADALQDGVRGEVLVDHGAHAALVLDELEALELREVLGGRVAGVVHVELADAPSRAGRLLLVLHDAAELEPNLFELRHRDRLPEVLRAHLADGRGLGLHRGLVLHEQLDLLLDAGLEVEEARVCRPPAEQGNLGAVHQQVEPVRLLLAPHLAPAHQGRRDGEEVGVGHRLERLHALALGQLLELPPAVLHVDHARRSEVVEVVDDEVEGPLLVRVGQLVDGHRRELDARLEDALQQRLLRRGLLLLVTLVEEPEVRPVVEDQELGLGPARAEQVGAQARAAADHLPELHVGADRLREDEVHDLGHVDARVEHVDREGDVDGVGERRVVALEVVDEVLDVGVARDDHAAEARPEVRVQLVEDPGEVVRVLLAPAEHDGLPHVGPRALADAVVHERAPEVLAGGRVEDPLVDVLGVVVDGLGEGLLLLELRPLLGRHLRVADALLAEGAAHVQDAERHEVGGRRVDGLLEREVRRGVVVLAAEELVGLVLDLRARGGREADLQGVEVPEDRAVLPVDAAVRLVGDDEVEEADVEVLEALVHRRVGREVDALVAVARRLAPHDDARLARQEVLEDVVGLAAELLAVAEEQDPLDPAGPHQHVAQRDGHARLARPRGLYEEGLAALVREPLRDALDRLELVDAVGDGEVRLDARERLLVRALVDQVLEAVLRVDAVDLAGRVALRVVPHLDVDAVGGEDHGPLPGGLLQAGRVHAGLLAANARVLGGALHLEDGEGLAVVAVEDVVGVAVARRRRDLVQLDLLPDLLGVLSAEADVPPGFEQERVDELAPRGRLVQLEQRRDLLALREQGLVVRALLGRGLFGLEALLTFFLLRGALGLELLQQGLVPGLGKPELLEGFLRLAVADRRTGGSHVGRAVGALAPVHLQVEPLGDLEQLRQAVEGELLRDGPAWVGGVVAGLAHRVQLAEHHLGDGRAERRLGEEIVEVVRVGPRELVRVVDEVDDVLDERALLDERARRVAVGVLLREGGLVGEDRALRAQELEVLRLHQREVLASHAATNSTVRAIIAGPRSSSTSS